MALSYINSKEQTYFLHTKEVLLKNGREQRIYFFGKQIKEGAIDALPDGFMIKENTQTGLPVLKRSVTVTV